MLQKLRLRAKFKAMDTEGEGSPMSQWGYRRQGHFIFFV